VSASTTEPTPEEYEQLRNATEAYYVDFISAQFSTNPLVKFVTLDFTLNFTLHGDAAGIPDARFNIYMEYSGAVFQFTPSPSNPDQTVLFDIMRKGITTDYLLDPVRKLAGTPFAEVTEGFMARP
jgi:hypothetical protein